MALVLLASTLDVHRERPNPVCVRSCAQLPLITPEDLDHVRIFAIRGALRNFAPKEHV